MKLLKIKIKNFRGYNEQVDFSVGDLTTIVGKNDIGKSSILEVLDIFFNKGKGTIKMDKDDVNKNCLSQNNNETEITVTFDEYPDKIIIDSTNETSLGAEYLLNVEDQLEIVKRYNNGGSEKVFIKAHHPSNENCSDLLLKKQKDLQSIIKVNGIDCDNKTRNAVMRAAI
ncbi:MAG: AAA family ATPase, partial [Cyclonatronaceae bacterium]